MAGLYLVRLPQEDASPESQCCFREAWAPLEELRPQ